MNNRNKVNDDDSDGDEIKRYIKAYIHIERERENCLKSLKENTGYKAHKIECKNLIIGYIDV